MRLPQPPPPALEIDASGLAKVVVLAQHLGPERRGAILDEANRRYLPWSEFRRRPPPEGLSPEDVWGLLEFLRAPHRRALPWCRKLDGGAFEAHFDDTLWAGLLRIERYATDPLGVLQQEVSAGTHSRVVADALAEEGIHSSLLEGAATTRATARQMIRERRSPLSHGERMIFNNYRTMERIDAQVARGASLDLDEILELHRTITRDTLLDPRDAGRVQEPGEQRVVVEDRRDGTVIHTPPAAGELPGRLERICALVNGEGSGEGAVLPAVVRAMLAHFQLAFDHPFVDGNGRTARALFYWCMRREGYDVFRYLTISRAFLKAPVKYAMAFVHSEQSGDATYFLRHHLAAIHEALDRLRTELAGALEERREAVRVADHLPELNLRQRMLVRELLADPLEELTARSLMGRFSIVRSTALADLAALQSLGLVRRRQEGRRLIYRAAPEFRQILHESGVE